MLPMTDRDRAGLLATKSHLTHALGALPRRGELIRVLLIRERLEEMISDVDELLAGEPAEGEVVSPDDALARLHEELAAAAHPKAGQLDERELARSGDDTGGWWE